MFGVPPYTAGPTHRRVDADDGAVTIRLADYFERPLRLDPGRGRRPPRRGSRPARGSRLGPDGPLATALEKLEAAVELRGGDRGRGRGAGAPRRRCCSRPPTRDERRDALLLVRPRRSRRPGSSNPSAFFTPSAPGTSPPIAGWRRTSACSGSTASAPRARRGRPSNQRVTDESLPDDLADRVYRPDPDDPRVTLRLAPEAGVGGQSLPPGLGAPAARRRLRDRPRR